MTKLGGALSVATLMVFFFIFFMMFVEVQLIRLVFIIVVVILMSAWLVHDTQIIVGGTHRKFQLEMDDYAVGALIIYSDILTIFLYLLELFGGR